MQTKKIAKNTIYLYLRQGLVMLVSLFTVRILLKGFGEVDYGIYNVVAGFVLLFGFFNSSLISGTQRFYNYELGLRGTSGFAAVYSSAIRIQLLISILVILALETIGVWYLNFKMVIPSEKLIEANWLMQLSLLSLLMTMLSVPYSSALVAKEQFNVFAIVGVIETFMKLGIAYVIMLLGHEKLVIYGALLVGVSAFCFLYYYLYCRRHYPDMFAKVPHDKKLTRSMISFMSWNTIGSSSYLVRNQGINLLFNSYFGILLNTANGIATQVSGAITHFSSNLVAAFNPQLVQAYARGDKSTSFYMMGLMTRASFALIYVLAIPVVLDIDYILHLWLGNDVPAETASLSVLVIISLLISCWHTPIAQLVHAIGKMGTFQIVTSVCILSIIPMAWIGFYFGLGPDWAYYAAIIAYVINQVAAMVVLHGIFSYSYKSYIKKTILPCMFFVIAMPIVPAAFRILVEPDFLQLLGLCAITVGMAIILMPAIILTKSERLSLFLFFKNKITNLNKNVVK